MMKNSNRTEVTYRGRHTQNIMHQASRTFSRIFFLHPDGSLLKDITNKNGNAKFKYYYYSTESVLDSMEEVGLHPLIIIFINLHHIRYWSCPNPGRNLTKMNCDIS